MYLYFTRSNGDVDSMENQPNLDTDAKRREFIGDPGATNFLVVSEADTMRNPSWNGSKYIDSDPNSEAKQALRAARNAALATVTVDIDGVDVWADPGNEQSIAGRIRQMEADGESSCEWIQGDDIFALTIDQLKTVLSEGTAKCAKIFDDYITAYKAL